MKRGYLLTLSLLSVFLSDSPGLAETPAANLVDELRANNVQQLVLTNACYRCDLVGVDLSEIHLIGADLRGATLAGANLSWSNLEGADLTGANLTGANLTGAFLTNASLARAILDNVNFTQAQLYYVDVTGASMENLNLADATVLGTPISIGGREPIGLEELPPMLNEH
ncbi:MAG: pentapeptide repeat-containing protein [Cyanobacteria bacterium P01_H01_bin.26]